MESDSRRPARARILNRGTAEQPPNRFSPLHYESDPEGEGAGEDDERPAPSTVFLRDDSRSVIARNDSPDVGFPASVNPYRGCEHGCIYCYARPTHEYLGFSAGLDFESRILVKEDAPELLRRELSSARWKPEVIALSGVTDPYQPIEGKLRLTRRVLEVLAEFRNPAAVVTKNALVTRDADVLGELARHQAAVVHVSVTTLRTDLWKVLEPRTSRPERRLEAIRSLSAAGIPAGVLVAPVIPGLTDSELPAIVEAVARAGARRVSYVLLRLPYGVKALFEDWLERHFPDRKRKILARIREVRGGKLNETAFGRRMKGEGIFAEQIAKLHRAAVRRAGLEKGEIPLSTRAFRRPDGLRQLDLFSP